MTKDELIEALESYANYDNETAHIMADDALLDYINDDEIRKAFNAIDKWYA